MPCRAVLWVLLALASGCRKPEATAPAPSEIERVLALAQTQASASPWARSTLGEPLRFGAWTDGKISTSGQVGFAYLTLPILGMKGEGNLHIAGEREGGLWQLKQLVLLRPPAEPYDLLAASRWTRPRSRRRRKASTTTTDLVGRNFAVCFQTISHGHRRCTDHPLLPGRLQVSRHS